MYLTVRHPSWRLAGSYILIRERPYSILGPDKEYSWLKLFTVLNFFSKCQSLNTIKVILDCPPWHDAV